jgi:hypothetical protein
MGYHIIETFHNLDWNDAPNASSFPGQAKRGGLIAGKLTSYTAYGFTNPKITGDGSDGYPPSTLVVEVDTTVDPSQAITMRNLISLTVHLFYNLDDSLTTFNFVPDAVQQQLTNTAAAGQAQVDQILKNTSPYEYLKATGDPFGAIEMGVKALVNGGTLPEDYQPQVDNSWSSYLPWIIGIGVTAFAIKKLTER